MEAISKRSRIGEIRLERRMLKRYDLLILKRNVCNGCSLCIEICPKNAIIIRPAVAKEGSLLHSPTLDIDKRKCILCGICAIICPLNALETWVNNEKNAMFTQNEAFPYLIKKISIDKNLCRPDCEIKCGESCPRDAIKTVIERQNGQVKKIIDVQVDEGLCIYCRACEYACPIGSITIKRPFEGFVKIDGDKCPERCHVCVDVCPSDAMKILKERRIEVDKKLCVVCKSCQTVCPERAISVSIEQVSHTPVKSSTWITLLQRFASSKVAMKEMATKSTAKRSSRIQTLQPTT